MINLINTGRYKINRQNILSQITAYLKKKGVSDDTAFSIVIVGQRKMKQVAMKYKNENTPLPVLAFPYQDARSLFQSEKDLPLGEIIICYPLAVLLAAERDKTVESVLIELIIHGLSTIV